jgi:hypothetical protein
LLQDDTGIVEIDLGEADLLLSDDKTIEVEERHRPLALCDPIRTRYIETRIAPGDQLYALGNVKRKMSGKPVLCRADGFLIVTDVGETPAESRYAARSRTLIILAVVAMGLTFACLVGSVAMMISI